MTADKKKVAIYARVSKDTVSSTGKMQDPEVQLIPLRKFADAMDWEVTAEFVDRASGGNSNRPDFQRLMRRVRQRHFDIILIRSLDRFSREGISNTLAYIETLKKYKTALKSTQEAWLDTTQEGIAEIILAMMAYFAKEARMKISRDTKAGLERARAKGKKLGRPRKI